MNPTPALLPALLAAVLLAGCAAPRREVGLLLRHSPGPAPIEYAIYVPRDYTPDHTWPCILFLHGRGESGDDGLKQCIQGLGSALQWNAPAWPCIILFPQKPDPEREWEEFDAAVLGILDDTQREFAVDPARVTLTGLSQGGHGTWALAARHPHRFAAIAPVCGYVSRTAPRHAATGAPRPYGAVDVDAARALAAAVAPLPVWAFHGERDDVVPPSHTRALVEACRDARSGLADPAELRATFLPDANHNSWDAAYRDPSFASWLLAQRRPLGR